MSDRLWSESGGEILDYARLCYEYVAANFKYLYTDTGISPIATILSDGEVIVVTLLPYLSI